MNINTPPALIKIITLAKRMHILLTKRRLEDGFLMRGATAKNSRLGENSIIHKNSSINNCKISIFSYISANSSIANCNIGSFCSIGPQCKIGLARHPSKVFCSTYPAFFSQANSGARKSFVSETLFDETPPLTKIGHDVWIGANAIVPGGVTIGNGSIIAAGSIVVKDVPEFAIVGGNPARLIGWRFNQEEQKELLSIAWWNWSPRKIERAASLGAFSSVSKLKEFSQSTILEGNENEVSR
ncbi:DapH/DapD/GlmU-related protein [Thioclava sp. DLFJ4-1]|nr:DapH/DapD/GlmU-related protein [Thioclava sp. DLFJ4-1]OOY07001.1 hypothetical protein BMI89_19985 [Thioclava sp. F36-7]OOY15376.1 hypothetical protein BMI85_15745 [Thioclava sp. DLFJ4-1]